MKSIFNTNCYRLPENFRLDLYTLLFQHPMSEYADENHSLDVLIIGNSLMCLNVFDIVLSNGQFSSKSTLNITVAVDDYKTFKKQAFDERPDLLSYITIVEDNKDLLKSGSQSFANVTCIDLNNQAMNHVIGSLQLKNNNDKYKIIIIADNSDQLITFANELAREFADSYNKHPFIAVHDQTKNNEVYDNIFNFADLFNSNGSELLRIGKNINFAYELSYDMHANKKSVDQNFNKDFFDEFHSSSQQDVNSYSAESSIAVAANIPMKIASCSIFFTEIPKEEIDPNLLLCQAIIKKNKLFSELIYMEHRRWLFFMLCKGFRSPKEEEMGYIYTNGNDHRNKKENNPFLHMCIANASPDGLNKEMDKPDFWASKTAPDQLSALDYNSWYCHRVAVQKSNSFQNADIKIFSAYPLLLTPQFSILKKSIDDLLNDKSNSVEIYRKTMSELKSNAKAENNPDVIKMLSNIEKKLDVVVKRNSKIDFYKLDAQLISKIPFSLWYEKKYKTVIIFGSGQPINDIMIPFLLTAKKCIFIYESADDENNTKEKNNYQKVVSDFLSETICIDKKELHFIPLPSLRSGDVSTQIQKILKDTSIFQKSPLHSEIIIFASKTDLQYLDEDIFKNNKKATIVKYDQNNGICSLDDKIFVDFVGLEHGKYLSIREQINLNYGKLLNKPIQNLNYSDYKNLEKIFSKYSEQDSAKWASVNDIFKNKEFTANKIILEADQNNILLDNYIISKELFYSSRLNRVLPMLALYHLIHYKISLRGDGFYFLELATKCSTIIEEIKNLVEKNDGNSEFEFDPFFLLKGKKSNLFQRISNKLENINITENVEVILSDLKEHDLIRDYSYPNDKQSKAPSVTFFPGRGIFQTLKNQGDVLEWITYHRLRETGLFADIQMNQLFDWSGLNLFNIEQCPTSLKDELDKFANNKMFSLITPKEYCDFLEKFKRSVNDFYFPSYQDQISSEIDVIASSFNKMLFFSCKSNRRLDTKNDTKYLDEIKNNANRYGAIPVFVYSTTDIRDHYIDRAYADTISLLDLKTLLDPKELVSAIKLILSGKTFKPKE